MLCLRSGHSRNCRSSTKCVRCRGKHHVSICQQSTEATNSTSRTDGTEPSLPPTPVLYVNTRTQVMLQTATIVVHHPRKPHPTRCVRAVLDCGSQQTYVTTSVQQALSLPTSSVEEVDIKVFGDSKGERRCCNLVSLELITRDGETMPLTALVVPHICDPGDLAKQYPHLRSLDLADDGKSETTAKIELLVGFDVYWSLVSGRMKRGNTGPVALDTKVGWVLSGPAERRETTTSISEDTQTPRTLLINTNHTEHGNLEEELKRFWDLEAIGVTLTEDSVHTKFNQEISFKDGRYEVGLPWRTNTCHRLPENYELCFKRLRGLHKRLLLNPTLLSAYNEVMHQQASDGIIERVSEKESESSLERKHYLPHHPVIRQEGGV